MVCEDVECDKNVIFEGDYATLAPVYNRTVLLHQKNSYKSSNRLKRYFRE